MAKLTQDIRNRIRSAVLTDIPTIDYMEQMRQRVIQIGRDLMPTNVRLVYDNPETRDFVRSEKGHFCCVSFYVPGARSYDDAKAALSGDARFAELHSLHDAQRNNRISIARDLEIQLTTVSTDKQFRERFPELANYLPEASSPVANLPATTAFIDTLRAAGLQLEAA